MRARPAAVAALALLLAPALAGARGFTAKLEAYDADGKRLNAGKLSTYVGRADRRGGPALWGWSPEGLLGTRPALSQRGDDTLLHWEKFGRLVLGLPWQRLPELSVITRA